jgi:shikimate dehydrogenase
MTIEQTFVLFGHPVSHSLSPVIHTAAYEALGLPHTYRVLDLPTHADLSHAFENLRTGVFGGANVTLPHKRAALELSDVVDPSADGPGVANVLCIDNAGRIHAHNTDADALADDIAPLLPDSPQGHAVVIGSGGAAFAAFVACKKLGYQRIGATSRSWTSWEYLAKSAVCARMRVLGVEVFPWPATDFDKTNDENRQAYKEWSEFVRASSLVLQATSAGMRGADAGEPIATIVPWDDLGERTLAYDLVYNPSVTPFLRAAMTQKLRARSGLGMLVRQAARSIELWTGRSPPLELMQRTARQTLDRQGQTV